MRNCLYLLLFDWFLAPSQSEIVCNVSQTPNGTLYKLSNISASDCPYNWSNSSGVISTNQRKLDGVVVNSSINSLLTHACYEEVTYKSLCESENTATCKTSCSVSSPNNGETSPNHIVVPVTVAGVVLLLIIVVVVVLSKLK